MSKSSVLAELKKAREQREGDIWNGTHQADFNQAFYSDSTQSQFSDTARQSRLNNTLNGILKTLNTANSGTVYAAAVDDLRQALKDYDAAGRTDSKGVTQDDYNARFYSGGG